MNTFHYIPESAEGEKCGVCGCTAYHKVEEVLPDAAFKTLKEMVNATTIMRHPFTTYLCCKCFSNVMGLAAQHICTEWWKNK